MSELGSSGTYTRINGDGDTVVLALTPTPEPDPPATSHEPMEIEVDDDGTIRFRFDTHDVLARIAQAPHAYKDIAAVQAGLRDYRNAKGEKK